MYVADEAAARIQRFGPNGTFVGKWGTHGSGDGQFHNPRGVATDCRGNVYVADLGNARIHKFGDPGVPPPPCPAGTPPPAGGPPPPGGNLISNGSATAS